MDQIHDLIAESVARNGLTGVAAVVVRLGSDSTVVCTGVSDVTSNRAVRADTVFRIA
jgi:CubicO group peptidase (beta-lactamase class C family)